MDTTETSVRNKTMFGGVKGKFCGLELFREGLQRSILNSLVMVEEFMVLPCGKGCVV